MKNKFISILSFVVVAIVSIISIVQTSYSQSSEDNERLMECQDYKGKFVADNPDAFLINCIEYVNSDYDSVQEYLAEEHPELKFE